MLLWPCHATCNSIVYMGRLGVGRIEGTCLKKCLKHTAFHEFLPGTSMAAAVNCSYKNMCKAFVQWQQKCALCKAHWFIQIYLWSYSCAVSACPWEGWRGPWKAYKLCTPTETVGSTSTFQLCAWEVAAPPNLRWASASEKVAEQPSGVAVGGQGALVPWCPALGMAPY